MRRPPGSSATSTRRSRASRADRGSAARQRRGPGEDRADAVVGEQVQQQVGIGRLGPQRVVGADPPRRRVARERHLVLHHEVVDPEQRQAARRGRGPTAGGGRPRPRTARARPRSTGRPDGRRSPPGSAVTSPPCRRPASGGSDASPRSTRRGRRPARCGRWRRRGRPPRRRVRAANRAPAGARSWTSGGGTRRTRPTGRCRRSRCPRGGSGRRRPPRSARPARRRRRRRAPTPAGRRRRPW